MILDKYFKLRVNKLWLGLKCGLRIRMVFIILKLFKNKTGNFIEIYVVCKVFNIFIFIVLVFKFVNF